MSNIRFSFCFIDMMVKILLFHPGCQVGDPEEQLGLRGLAGEGVGGVDGGHL